MKKGDKILIISILGLAILGLFIGRLPASTREDRFVVIKVGGKIHEEIHLIDSLSRVIEVRTPQGGFNLIEIRDGRVRITDANCPERLCVRSAPIGLPGQAITCLPHRLVVYIEGKEDRTGDAIDGLSY